ncbi:hypothetical protein BC826DRAFT_1180906 [Russula brevipes]|nr:hypothetical protein BC826DRAFT_1180906 [Russula brevipes]
MDLGPTLKAVKFAYKLSSTAGDDMMTTQAPLHLVPIACVAQKTYQCLGVLDVSSFSFEGCATPISLGRVFDQLLSARDLRILRALNILNGIIVNRPPCSHENGPLGLSYQANSANACGFSERKGASLNESEAAIVKEEVEPVEAHVRCDRHTLSEMHSVVNHGHRLSEQGPLILQSSGSLQLTSTISYDAATFGNLLESNGTRPMARSLGNASGANPPGRALGVRKREVAAGQGLANSRSEKINTPHCDPKGSHAGISWMLPSGRKERQLSATLMKHRFSRGPP